MKRRKQVPLGPGPDEIAAAQGIDLSRPRRARGRVTQTIRGKEDPRLKAKRHRQEFFRNIDRRRLRKKDVPDNCALVYMSGTSFAEIMDKETHVVQPRLEPKSFIQGEPGRGMTVVLVNDEDITQFHITHILKSEDVAPLKDAFWTVK